MSLAKVYSSAVLGIDAYSVEVEVDIAKGLPSFNTVGLPDVAVKESKDRVKAAIKNSDFKFPTKRITVNLAPADVKKEGSLFDLPIALGILAATGQIEKAEFKKYVILGELSLDGGVRSIPGALPIALAAQKEGREGIILPLDNRAEAAVVKGLNVYPVENLSRTVDFLTGKIEIEPFSLDLEGVFEKGREYKVDFTDVKGQEHAKRALEVAAAGGHNVIMIGPPGSGKTMLSRRLPTILPDLTLEEALETTKIHSIAGLVPPQTALIAIRPFRSPHHTASDIALIGGGRIPRPGEVSLAHHGVLFLDELPEFKRNVLEVLRQPLEDGAVTISRAVTSLSYPAQFMLTCAMNPCPCGFFGDPVNECTCTPPKIQKYRSRISGPLLDRIDIHLEVPRVKYKDLASQETGERSEVIRKRVNRARVIQQKRFQGQKGIFCNAHMETKEIKEFCKITTESQDLIKLAITQLGLSARAYDRILKVSRTIADLEGKSDIEPAHVSEAIGYRSLDRTLWM
ncbi:YifB family Mg chelatase-like AAA ATPase [bacterium]|nr:YifB family Mg chelatase-like AAA ATPase [bacterium]